MSTWKKVGIGLWVRVYDFGGNPINTLAIDIGEGGLAIISPGTKVPEEDFAELDCLGTVKALVTPGAYHNMGLPLWSDRYPEAGLYGPASAVKHIAKAHKTLKPLEDLDALVPLLPSDVSITEMPEAKHPDVLAIITRSDAVTWLTNECLSNSAKPPSNLIFALLFRITGNAPGLNVNTITMKFTGAKKTTVRDYFLSKLKSDPLTRLIPCHGEVLDDPKLAERMQEMLTRRLG